MQNDLNPLMAVAVADYLAGPDPNRRNDSSATWTTSSGDVGISSDSDEIEDRVHFVDEYNRLAKKHSIRLMVKEDLDSCPDADRTVGQERKSSWFRSLLREFSGGNHGDGSRHASGTRSVRKVSSKRSLTDIASHLIHPKKDGFKDEDLQTLVRLCGKSKFYLPSEYAPASLVLPTCFRATAQYLVQHGTETRGIFLIPGSARVVGAIYDHYCPTQDEAEIIDTTVCSPNLPAYFKANVHDVASAFKKFLAGLPGGILGSLALFDAFVAIHSQLYADPELNRTKQSKLRARLIALAIGTLKSQYRRELICAVFGLLSLIGRAAETAPREDGSGRPLPTSDLIGYNALGNIFGPLLVGNLLDSYTMKLANPSEGLILLPVSPPSSRRDRSGRKSKAVDDTHPPPIEVDKIQVASRVTEMIITHWREVVRHLKNLGALRTRKDITATEQSQLHMRQLRPSASESFMVRQPADWHQWRPPSVYSDSPVPRQSSFSGKPAVGRSSGTDAHETLNVRKRRPKSGRTTANDRLTRETSRPVLSPTVEEAGSPYPQEAGETTQGLPSIDTHAADTKQESSQDPDYGLLLQTASPQKPLIPGKSSRRKKRPKFGSTKAKKPHPIQGSDPAESTERAHLDAPAPILSRRESMQANEHGIQPHEHDVQPDVAVDAKDWAKKQHSPFRPTAGAEEEFELDAQTPFIHPGEFPQSPDEVEAHPATPYVHPGAFPPSPPKPTDPELGADRTTAASPSYPFITPPAELPESGEEGESRPGRLDKTTASTLGHSFKATLDEATNSLTRGVSSAVSALVEVFDVPSSNRAGPTSPTKIPGPYGSLRRNSRPSKHRRLQKRKSPDVPVPTLVNNGLEQRGMSLANTESAQPVALDTAPERNWPETGYPAAPGDNNQAPQEGGSLIDTGVGLDDLSREQSMVRNEVLGTDFRPANPNLWVQSSANYSVRSYFPSIDGNQSSAISDTARDHASNSGADDQNKKRDPDTADVGVTAYTEGPYTGMNHETPLAVLEDSSSRGNLNSEAWDHFRANTGAKRRSGKVKTDGSGPGEESHSHTPQDQHHPGIDDPAKVNHSVDVRPQRSVRRLSHIFKGMRRSSTVATPPSTSNRRGGGASHLTLSTTPSLKHVVRRSSTSAASSSQTPPVVLPDSMILGPGRMTPYREDDQPPVASHLSRKLPPRSATPSMETLLPRSSAGTPGGGGSNAALYNQVLTLQRQLAARTEELAHLRRQLEAVGEGGAAGAGQLSERLRVAEREVKMWRDRATAAERRVVVFERFLGRVRQLRQKRAEAARGDEGGEGARGGEMEEGIEEEIEREMKAIDGAEKVDGGEICQLDGVGGMNQTVKGGSGTADVGVWVTAAKEVLEYDDERSWMRGRC